MHYTPKLSSQPKPPQNLSKHEITRIQNTIKSKIYAFKLLTMAFDWLSSDVNVLGPNKIHCHLAFGKWNAHKYLILYAMRCRYICSWIADEQLHWRMMTSNNEKKNGECNWTKQYEQMNAEIRIRLQHWHWLHRYIN